MSTQHVQWLFAVSTMEPYHYDLSLTDFKLETSTFCDHTPTQKDKQCISNSRYKCTEAAKRLRKRARRKRKGLDDRHQEREGPNVHFRWVLTVESPVQANGCAHVPITNVHVNNVIYCFVYTFLLLMPLFFCYDTFLLVSRQWIFGNFWEFLIDLYCIKLIQIWYH